MIRTWWDKNKVWVIGLVSAVALALTPFVQGADVETTWKVIGIAAATAALGYVAKTWRGTSMTILGILGNVAAVMATVIGTGVISWPQIIVQLIVMIGLGATPNPKSRAYELQPAIRNAKVQGEVDEPAMLTNLSVKEDAAKLLAMPKPKAVVVNKKH